jgi:hypothetical protein
MNAPNVEVAIKATAPAKHRTQLTGRMNSNPRIEVINKPD